MGILELLQVDKCSCITTFKDDRFQNITQLKKDLDISVEFIDAIRDPVPHLSYAKTFMRTIRSYRGKYKRVLMFEDDAWTDMSRNEMKLRIIESGIPSMKYDVLSLGSQAYVREEYNPFIYRTTAFGYSHAVCFNLETLSDEFFNSVEEGSTGENYSSLDSSISRSLIHTQNSYVIKESLFLQRNLTSILLNTNINSKLDFRHTRDQQFNTGGLIEKSKTVNIWGDYLNVFGNFHTDCVTLSLHSSIKENTTIMISDYYSGIYLTCPSGFYVDSWYAFRCPADVIVLELASDGKIYHREVLDVSQIPLTQYAHIGEFAQPV
jgi:hypothetical protein